MEKRASYVPKYIYVIIIATLAVMFIYGQYIDSTPAEKTVENFYNAYFNRDFDTVAQYLSVFWSVQFLPQYQDLSPRELIERRPDIEKDIARILAELEKDITYPEDLHIVINSEYTRETANSAIVGYVFQEKEETSGVELAILINESGAYRIYSVISADQADLNSITDENMEILDANFKKLLEQK